MDKKLNFHLLGKPWNSLLFKSLLFVGFLAGICYFRFAFWSLLLFAIFLFWFYYFQLWERNELKFSFFVLSIGCLLILYFWGSGFYSVLIGCVVAALLFYLLVGLANFFFKEKFSVYLFLNTGLLLIIFALFFNRGAEWGNYFSWLLLLLFLIVFLLLRECFLFWKSTASHLHYPSFFALLGAFLSVEMFWAVGLLPLGFIKAAIFLTTFVFLFRDAVLAYAAGRFNKRFFAGQIFIFLVLSSLVLAAGQWSL